MDDPTTPKPALESPENVTARSDQAPDAAAQRAQTDAEAARNQREAAERAPELERARAQREAALERARAEREKSRETEQRPLYEGKARESAEGAPEIDHGGVLQRLLGWMRSRGQLTHRELVEMLGLEGVEIEHKHPDTGAWETKDVTAAGGTRPQKIGTASVAEDSVAARHYVQEVLAPGSTQTAESSERDVA